MPVLSPWETPTGQGHLQPVTPSALALTGATQLISETQPRGGVTLALLLIMGLSNPSPRVVPFKGTAAEPDSLGSV